jgi:hypothetical protein
MKFLEYLKSLGACGHAIDWVGEKTREEAISECCKTEWLLWLLVHEDRQAVSALVKEFVERAKAAAAGSSAMEWAMKAERAASEFDSRTNGGWAAAEVAALHSRAAVHPFYQTTEQGWQLERMRELLKKTKQEEEK